MSEIIGKLIENLKQFVDLLKSNLLIISISLAFFSGLILILPESLFSRFYLVNIRKNSLTIIGAIAFTSLFLTILLILYRILAFFYTYIRGSFLELSRLTPEECSRLKSLHEEKKSDCNFQYN